MSLTTTEQSFFTTTFMAPSPIFIKSGLLGPPSIGKLLPWKNFMLALPFLINKRKEKHPHNNGMKFHVQVRDIGSDQDNGIAMLSFANLLDLLPYQLKDWNDSQEREREWRIYDIWKQRQFAIKLLRLRCKSSLIRFWSIA